MLMLKAGDRLSPFALTFIRLCRMPVGAAQPYRAITFPPLNRFLGFHSVLYFFAIVRLAMDSPERIISSAFENLRLSIREEDAYDWASTAPKDVWNAIREIDASQRKRRTAQNLRRVEPFLRGLEEYAKVIEVLCNGTPYLPYVWVGFPPDFPQTKRLTCCRPPLN